MAPVPISGEHLLYDTIDRAINADKGLTLKDTTSGWGCEQPYYNWSPPEPRLFEDASTREPSQWEKFIESLLVADSWFDWSSNEDTSIRVGSLAEFEGTGDGVVGDIPNLSISRDEWWDLPRDSGPKIPMPLGYQKSSSSVMTGRLEAPINTTTAQGVPRIPTRPKSSTYTTHDFGIWPPEMTVSPTQYDKDWFLTKRGGMRFIRYIMQLPC